MIFPNLSENIVGRGVRNPAKPYKVAEG